MESAVFLFAFADLPLAMAGVGGVVLGPIWGGLPLWVGTDFCGARGSAGNRCGGQGLSAEEG
ncbi:MAG: hypothetical protein ACUVQS_04480 [Candidatus Bipolaricaulaceae bacterium]